MANCNLKKDVVVFNKISIKLAFLLNKAPDEKVLLVGKRAFLWEEDFLYYFYHCKKSSSFSDNIDGVDWDSIKYGLILWDMTAEDRSLPIEECLMLVHRLLSKSGSLFLICNNRYSIRKIKQFCRRSRYRYNSILSRGLKSYKNLLKKVGFTNIRGFLPLPSVDDMEDIVTDEVEEFQLPDYVHITQKIANSFGFYKKIHDGYIFLASVSVFDPIDQFMQWLEVTLSDKLQEKHKFRLERFDLRKQGALIIFVKDSQSNKKYVVRVAVNKDINDKIKNNALQTYELHQNKDINQKLKDKVPTPLLHTDYLGRDLYVEKMLPGKLAWKIIGNATVKKKIELNAFRFISDLNSSTKNSYYVDDKLVELFLKKDINKLNQVISLTGELKSAILNIVSSIKKKMIGKTFIFVWGHGDYGYGNIFIDENNLEIVGIIDWVEARTIELPGVDMINMRIQGEKSENENSLLKSFKNVVEEVLATGIISNQLKNSYKTEFQLGIEEIKLILLVTTIRFIAREVQYSINEEEKREFLDILNYLTDKICDE
jgi:hypothetical protein